MIWINVRKIQFFKPNVVSKDDMDKCEEKELIIKKNCKKLV